MARKDEWLSAIAQAGGTMQAGYGAGKEAERKITYEEYTSQRDALRKIASQSFLLKQEKEAEKKILGQRLAMQEKIAKMPARGTIPEPYRTYNALSSRLTRTSAIRKSSESFLLGKFNGEIPNAKKMAKEKDREVWRRYAEYTRATSDIEVLQNLLRNMERKFTIMGIDIKAEGGRPTEQDISNMIDSLRGK